MGGFSLNRIRILKTGLAYVDNYIDMSKPENIKYFEKLATPGTQLKLKRVRDFPDDPFRIEVLSPDDKVLGYVTFEKNETTARLIDAGARVIAIVNESLPIHGSDSSLQVDEYDNAYDGGSCDGWSEKSRIRTGYAKCNLPYCIYLVDD